MLGRKSAIEIKGWTCSGVFHQRSGFQERSVLELKRRDRDNGRSLLVIMMNPGGSRPSDEKFDTNEKVPALADRTQLSVVKFAEDKGYDQITIINLVDLCEPNSRRLKSYDLSRVTSRFFDERKAEFFDLVKQHGGHVLVAWGSPEPLRNQARRALAWLHEYDKKFGVHLWGNRRADRDFFFHPLAWVLGGWRAGVGPITKI